MLWNSGWILTILVIGMMHVNCCSGQDNIQIPSSGCSPDKCSMDDRVWCKVSSAGSHFDMEQFTSGDPATWAGPPSQLDVVETPLTNGNVRIRITWKLPSDASSKILSGFYLKILTATNSGMGFYIAINQSDLLRVGFRDVLNLEFFYDCLEFDHLTEEIFIFLYSLPVPHIQNLMSNVLVRFHSFSEANTTRWVDSISKYSIIPHHDPGQPCGHSVQFSFSLNGNPELAFYVQLYHILPNGTIVTISTTRNTRYHLKPMMTFNSLCSGRYKIQVWPLKRDLRGQCVCGIADQFTNQCEYCIRLPLYFKLDPVTAISTVSTSSQKQSEEKSSRNGSSLELVFGILALLCLVVAIIIALVILLYYKKYFHVPEKKGSPVLTNESLAVLAKEVSSKGLPLAMLLNIPTTRLVNMRLEGNASKCSEQDMCTSMLHHWRELRATAKEKDKVLDLERSLKELGFTEIADVINERHRDQLELTADSFPVS